MQEILNCMTLFSQLPQIQHQQQQMKKDNVCDCAGTQTEIVAVHTPQIEQLSEFPFVQKIPRPCSLPINDCSTDK
jgi:centrosomal protein CEP97